MSFDLQKYLLENKLTTISRIRETKQAQELKNSSDKQIKLKNQLERLQKQAKERLLHFTTYEKGLKKVDNKGYKEDTQDLQAEIDSIKKQLASFENKESD